MNFDMAVDHIGCKYLNRRLIAFLSAKPRNCKVAELKGLRRRRAVKTPSRTSSRGQSRISQRRLAPVIPARTEEQRESGCPFLLAGGRRPGPPESDGDSSAHQESVELLLAELAQYLTGIPRDGRSSTKRPAPAARRRSQRLARVCSARPVDLGRQAIPQSRYSSESGHRLAVRRERGDGEQERHTRTSRGNRSTPPTLNIAERCRRGYAPRAPRNAFPAASFFFSGWGFCRPVLEGHIERDSRRRVRAVVGVRVRKTDVGTRGRGPPVDEPDRSPSDE